MSHTPMTARSDPSGAGLFYRPAEDRGASAAPGRAPDAPASAAGAPTPRRPPLRLAGMGRAEILQILDPAAAYPPRIRAHAPPPHQLRGGTGGHPFFVGSTPPPV